ncbi:MAG: type II toxin-antitoxin system mRNA interferase toxin, RelE/StbE family, partial [Alphaproteobacteria bacterium]|nr:type II toxin-antitoxin system mRNA interferase toxin, RelE/StbE family [Alphaproteobacteria bacterium]
LGDLWKYRVGDDRLIVSIEDETVRRLGHRRDEYRR